MIYPMNALANSQMKFRFCPCCGDYSIGAGRDINRLAGLTAEGRSSATTILVSSIIRWMNGPGAPAIIPFRRKLLGFTDNRQDAALQDGHFNDFVFVTRLRGAVLAGLAHAGGAGAVEAEIASSLQNALGFVRAREDRRPDWLQEPELKGAHLNQCRGRPAGCVAPPVLSRPTSRLALHASKSGGVGLCPR